MWAVGPHDCGGAAGAIHLARGVAQSGTFLRKEQACPALITNLPVMFLSGVHQDTLVFTLKKKKPCSNASQIASESGLSDGITTHLVSLLEIYFMMSHL